jgi:hypothetical protein
MYEHAFWESKRRDAEQWRPREFDEASALDAAMDCFWKDSYEATPVRNLAARMGICARFRWCRSPADASRPRLPLFRTPFEDAVGRRLGI